MKQIQCKAYMEIDVFTLTPLETESMDSDSDATTGNADQDCRELTEREIATSSGDLQLQVHL